LMPPHLLQAMPMLVLAIAAFLWIVVRALILYRLDDERGFSVRRDLWVGLALAASWLALWGLYAAYYWTNDPTENTMTAARFYVPAIGAISLLGAWLVTRIPGRAWLPGLALAAVVTLLFVQGNGIFQAMVAWSAP
jgi:hypothetical protein